MLTLGFWDTLRMDICKCIRFYQVNARATSHTNGCSSVCSLTCQSGFHLAAFTRNNKLDFKMQEVRLHQSESAGQCASLTSAAFSWIGGEIYNLKKKKKKRQRISNDLNHTCYMMSWHRIQSGVMVGLTSINDNWLHTDTCWNLLILVVLVWVCTVTPHHLHRWLKHGIKANFSKWHPRNCWPGPAALVSCSPCSDRWKTPLACCPLQRGCPPLFSSATHWPCITLWCCPPRKRCSGSGRCR